jgi:hypothetical protein
MEETSVAKNMFLSPERIDPTLSRFLAMLACLYVRLDPEVPILSQIQCRKEIISEMATLQQRRAKSPPRSASGMEMLEMMIDVIVAREDDLRGRASLLIKLGTSLIKLSRLDHIQTWRLQYLRPSQTSSHS